MSLTDLDRFKAACVYPGVLDEQAVERELAAFLRALGVSRRIVRLRAAHGPEDDPPPDRSIVLILRECVQRNLGVRYRYPRAALARRAHRRLRATLDGEADVAFIAVDARTARGASYAGAGAAALDHLVDPVDWAGFALVLGILAVLAYYALGPALGVLFALFVAAGLFTGTAAYCALGVSAFAHFAADPGARGFRTTFWESVWELSWTVCALFGAVGRRKPAAEAWLRPLFEAFVGGCWLLYWADDTLYWVAKPTVRCEPGTQRLHHDTRAALESDIVKLYFWRGVRVPPFIILRPDLITIAHIDRETNVEVRRVMIERYRHGEEIHGAAAFVREAGGRRIDHDERYGTLWLRKIPGDEYIPGDEPIVMIEVVIRTPEPDSRFKHYWLRVPPTMRTAREAVAWAFPDFWSTTENRGFSLYRQGDVLIISVEWIPEKLDPVGRERGRVVLAHSEVTGHAHAIRAEGAALFRDPKLMAVFMTVTGDAPVALEHADHATIMIPPGKYRVVRPREYSPWAVQEAIRHVAD